MRPCFVALCLALVFILPSSATTIRVPQDQPTIQLGIEAAQNGDTVLVSPGTYYESINFNGREITVESSNGPSVTFIDGSQQSTVVFFLSAETRAATLRGFTIQNGNGTFNGIKEGGGIFVGGASPTIVENVIINNQACQGDGIAVGVGSPLIRGNLISKNLDAPECGGGIGGGGILISGVSSAQILNNRIVGNKTLDYGGGISLWDGNAVQIKNNVIANNVGHYNGGGISMFNDTSSVVIIQNLIYGNQSVNGNGVYWSTGPSAFVNNTVIDSPSSSGGGTVAGDELCCGVRIANNLIIAAGGAVNAFVCNNGDFSPDVIGFNDVFSSVGPAYGGKCSDQTGILGNISANPQFVDPSKRNFQLASGSPAIDAGHNSPRLPKADLAGNPRVVGPRVDMGAYEYQGNEARF